MKMINSTRRMSMSGTTFMDAIAPPFFPPTSIPIGLLLFTARNRAVSFVS
jgi:hypothetical protein